MIEVNNLVKHYRKADKNAVDGVSFKVAEGEFFAFLGPNGAGKTTTISILTTTLMKTSGKIRVAGYDLDTQEDLVRRNIGIIFQNPSLDANLSGEENIRFHASLYGVYPFRPSYRMMPAEYKRKVMDLAEVMDMQEAITKPVKDYSGGMKRKLEIVRSLIHEPKVLFLDEPTTGLDPLSRRNLWDYLDKVRQERGTTVFLTTHYLDEAETADRVCIIMGGKIVKLGKPGDIKEELVHEYLILDADDRKSLGKELAATGAHVEGAGPFRVMINGHDMQSIIKSVDTKLSLIRTDTPTLEDAYLDIIGEKDNA